MQRVNFYLTEQQVTALTELSESSGLSVSELIRRAIDAFLSKSEKRS